MNIQHPSSTSIPALRIASWNLENFTAAAPAKVTAAAHVIVDGMQAPHILAVQEMCGDSDGSAKRHADALIAAIVEAGGPHYAYTEMPGYASRDGGAPTAHIRCGYLYRPDRVTLSQHPDAPNPSYIAAESAAFTQSRKPLLAHFTDRLTDEEYSIINLHLASDGMHQAAVQKPGEAWSPNMDRLEKRNAQAAIVGGYVSELSASLEKESTADRHHMIVCGDLNTPAIAMFPGQANVHKHLNRAGLTNLEDRLPMGSYSHEKDGMHMTLDYLYVSPGLAARIDEVVRPVVNDPSTHRVSDHNPTFMSIAPLERLQSKAQRLQTLAESPNSNQR